MREHISCLTQSRVPEVSTEKMTSDAFFLVVCQPIQARKIQASPPLRKDSFGNWSSVSGLRFSGIEMTGLVTQY